MEMIKPKHHQTPIIRIEELITHPNADNLELVKHSGYRICSMRGIINEPSIYRS